MWISYSGGFRFHCQYCPCGWNLWFSNISECQNSSIIPTVGWRPVIPVLSVILIMMAGMSAGCSAGACQFTCCQRDRLTPCQVDVEQTSTDQWHSTRLHHQLQRRPVTGCVECMCIIVVKCCRDVQWPVTVAHLGSTTNHWNYFFLHRLPVKMAPCEKQPQDKMVPEKLNRPLFASDTFLATTHIMHMHIIVCIYYNIMHAIQMWYYIHALAISKGTRAVKLCINKILHF